MLMNILLQNVLSISSRMNYRYKICDIAKKKNDAECLHVFAIFVFLAQRRINLIWRE